ncbi:MAG: class I SAM-dependent methyltransferase [Pseudomonadota bacterium]|nr:class I SAM-dependent methyltransferase [Pseudomonadota bacterium]
MIHTTHASAQPSAWVRRFAHLIAPGGTVLDVACGSGRHLQWLLAQGLEVTGVDRNAAALEPLRELAEIVVADLEGAPWPLPGRHFDGVVVTNYLWRPLWPALLAALDEGGVFIHETFAHGQQSIGRPTREDFLLKPGELLQACASLHVVAYEDGFEGPETEHESSGVPGTEHGRFVQRIVAIRRAAFSGEPPRHELSAAAARLHDRTYSPAG